MALSVRPRVTLKGQIKVICWKTRFLWEIALYLLRNTYSNGNVVSSILGDLEWSDQDHSLKNTVSVRDSVILTEEHL